MSWSPWSSQRRQPHPLRHRPRRLCPGRSDATPLERAAGRALQSQKRAARPVFRRPSTMKRGALVAITPLALLLLAALAHADSRLGPHLERPKGWRLEETAYPPPWAKELPWQGALEIRFPPGWFDKDSPFYWSYPVL